MIYQNMTFPSQTVRLVVDRAVPASVHCRVAMFPSKASFYDIFRLRMAGNV